MEHSTKGESNFKKVLIPEGEHLAICWAFTHLGTHVETSKYSPPEGKDEPRMTISFEFPELRAVYNEDKGEQIMSYHERWKKYKFHYKSGLCTQLLGPWRNVTITEKDKINLSHYLGQPLMITITHKVVGENTYENATYSHVPKKMLELYLKEGTLTKEGKKYKTENEQRILELGDFNQDVFDVIPDFQKQKITESNEWPNLVSSGQAKAWSKEEEGEDPKPIEVSDDSDEIEF